MGPHYLHLIITDIYSPEQNVYHRHYNHCRENAMKTLATKTAIIKSQNSLISNIIYSSEIIIFYINITWYCFFHRHDAVVLKYPVTMSPQNSRVDIELIKDQQECLLRNWKLLFHYYADLSILNGCRVAANTVEWVSKPISRYQQLVLWPSYQLRTLPALVMPLLLPILVTPS